jgi:hypothetical protein
LNAGCGAPTTLNPISALLEVVLVSVASPKVVLLLATTSFFLACPVDTDGSFVFPIRPTVLTVAQFSASLRQCPSGVVDSSILSTDRDILQSLHKPMKFYNRKSKASRLSKMDAGLFAKVVSMISVPPIARLSGLFR